MKGIPAVGGGMEKCAKNISREMIMLSDHIIWKDLRFFLYMCVSVDLSVNYVTSVLL